MSIGSRASEMADKGLALNVMQRRKGRCISRNKRWERSDMAIVWKF